MDPHDFNFAHSLAVFASTSKTGELTETRDLLLTSSGAPVASFNQGMFKTPAYKFERTLERARAYQLRAGVPVRLHLSSEHASLGPLLVQRGYVQADSIPVMVFEPIDRKLPEALPALSIERVRDAGALADCGRIAFGTLGFPPEFAPLTFTEDLLSLPHVELYVGYAAGVPVCCSMLLVTGFVAGLYWVGVLETHRRQGFGAAVTAHAVRAGVRRGCTMASLQASPMGAPVYRRLGFQQVREYLRFDSPAP